MKPRSFSERWNRFFFEPQRPTSVALFRILYGLLNIANLALLRPDWLTWYGRHAYMSMETMNRLSWGPRINLFVLFPQTDFAVNVFFWIFLAFAVSLTVGFMTRLSCVAVFICLISMHERNLYILNGADSVMRVTGFFLMFAPAGGALSIDRLRRIRAGREGAEVPLYSPWAQRMIQLQVSVIYLSTVGLKLYGKSWRNGTAIYYVLRLNAFRRFPVPFSNNLFLIRFFTWATLVVEFAIGALVWIVSLRYAVLIAATLLHLFIEYSMNLPVFELMMMSTYVTFIYPEDLSRAWKWIARRAGPRLGATATVVYDATSDDALRTANLLRALDVFDRLRILDAHSTEGAAAFPLAAGGNGSVQYITDKRAQAGFAGLCSIAPLVPLLWPLALFGLFRNRAPEPEAA
ncbi:MAG: HTTM domain-containing protein [Acidobacteriia bacterium]|nr:HTTM domain-containing protein [Terriglobia bacterium]